MIACRGSAIIVLIVSPSAATEKTTGTTAVASGNRNPRTKPAEPVEVLADAVGSLIPAITLSLFLVSLFQEFESALPTIVGAHCQQHVQEGHGCNI